MCVQRGWHLQMAWRLMGSRRASLDSLKKGGVLPSPCASHIFSLHQRISSPRKLAVSQLWRWAESEGRAASTFPSRWWEGTYRLFALLSWWVEAWQHRDGRMLSTASPGNFTHCQGKPELLSKGFATELSVKTRARNHQAEAHSPRMIRTHHSLPSWAGICVTSSCRLTACELPACLQLIPISGVKWVDPGAQSPQRLIERTEPGRTHRCATSVALTSFPYNTASQISRHRMYRTLLLKCEAVYHPLL